MPRKQSPDASRKRTARRPSKAALAMGAIAGDVESVTSFLTRSFPSINVVRKLHHASFLIREKVFAFTRPDGIVLKLPEPRIEALLKTRNAEFLVMGKRTMREWVLLHYARAGEFAEDIALFREAMDFVASSS